MGNPVTLRVPPDCVQNHVDTVSHVKHFLCNRAHMAVEF